LELNFKKLTIMCATYDLMKRADKPHTNLLTTTMCRTD